MLGCTRSGVRYLERIGLLTPEKDPKGIRRFNREQVEALLSELRRQGPRPSLVRSGSLAARVFKMFRDGLSFPEIVIKTEETPETIRALFEEYRRPLGESKEEPKVWDDLSDFDKRARDIEDRIIERRKTWRK
jgi:DNA-binding transcriptional MerR regulator